MCIYLGGGVTGGSVAGVGAAPARWKLHACDRRPPPRTPEAPKKRRGC